MATVIEDAVKTGAKPPETTNWGGQQVLTGGGFKDTIAGSAAAYNKSAGTNLTPEEFDRMVNPTTAGARWGDPAPPPKTGGGLLTPTAPTAATPTAAATTTVPAATSVGYTPTEQKVTPESLVQNQVQAITSTGSQLTEAAKARAQQQAARRGLLNSTMAAEAGQKAVLESALPIAQQDAGTFAGANAANAQFANAASQFGAAAQNTATLANQQAALSQRLAEIQASTSMSIADKQLASQRLIADNENKTRIQLQQMNSDTQKVIQTLGDDAKMKLSQLEADNRQLLQTNISAANSYAQYVQALAQISTSDKMDATAKQQAADNQLAALQANLRAIGDISGLDLSRYYQAAPNMSAQAGASTQPTDKEVEETSKRLNISKENAKEYLLSGGTRGIGGAANVAGNIAAPGLGKLLGKIF